MKQFLLQFDTLVHAKQFLAWLSRRNDAHHPMVIGCEVVWYAAASNL